MSRGTVAVAAGPLAPALTPPAPAALRVLHVVRRLGYGGLEMEIVNLVAGLHERGFTQAVCCLEDAGPLAAAVPAVVPVWTCTTAAGERPQRLPWRAGRQIRAWRPDVVHARNGGAWIDGALAWVLAGRPGRLAFSIHGWDRRDRMPRRRALVYRQLARGTAGLAAISAATRDQFAGEAGIAADRFAVLRSGIDVDRFAAAVPRDRPTDRPLVLGSVGRLDPIKAYDRLLDAFARLHHQGVGGAAGLELHLVGDGPCRADLERQAKALGIATRVRFRGFDDRVADRLHEFDLFVLLSHREGRPISIMEAMAAGLPVVATRVGSVADLVVDGETGRLVEPGDVEGWVATLADLVADAPARQRLGRAARERAVAELSLDRMVADYAAFYQGLAARA